MTLLEQAQQLLRSSEPSSSEALRQPSLTLIGEDASRSDAGTLAAPLAQEGLSNEDLKALAESDLFIFAKGILGFDWLDPEIHKPLCKILEDYESVRRGVVVLPRSWLKTTLCSIAYPIWRAVRANGNLRILLVQNTYENAVGKLKSIKAQWENNELLRTLWPELIPTPQSVWKSDSLCLNRSISFPESTFECGGTRTQFTSRHYDIIIEDDTVAPKLSELGEENVAPIKEDIEQAIGFHQGCTDLQNDFARSQILVVGTRWFERDLISYIELEQNKRLSEAGALQYRVYKRACLENEKGEADENGTPTYPARFNEAVLNQLRAEKGSYMFSCLYLNLPLRSIDMPFRQEWFKYYENPPKELYTYTTGDPAGDPEDTVGEADFNVVMTCGVHLPTGRKYVLAYDRFQGTPTEFVDKLFLHQARWNPECVGVETTQYQKSIMHYVRNEMRDREVYFSIRPLKNAGKGRTKNLRIQGLQPLFEKGDIFLKTEHRVLMTEALAFPYGKNDDVLDALAMQLELWALLRKERPEKEKVAYENHQLGAVLAKVEKDRAVRTRRLRVMGMPLSGEAHTRSRYRNGRLVTV